jgi:hypothetical protein
MKPTPVEFQSVLAAEIADFLRHQRSLGKRFLNEERGLRLFDRYLAEQNIRGSAEITAAMGGATMHSPSGTVSCNRRTPATR